MFIGDQIRVGVITPHLAPGAEVEFPRLAPGHVRVQLARVADPVARPSHDAGPATAAESLRARMTPAALEEAASAFPLGSLDVLVLASTSSGYVLGHEGEQALARGLQEQWGLPVHTSCLAAVEALESRDAGRIRVVHPPWFGSRLNELGVEYFRQRGFDVVDAQVADLPGDPGRVERASIIDWVSSHQCPDADALVIGGHGFGATGAVQELEARTGQLVVEANQALLWSVLRGSHDGAGATRGFGSLLDDVTERK